MREPLLFLWAPRIAAASALLALVVHELFDPSQIGRLMGLTFVFCMAATMAGNTFSAWVFDTTGSYLPAWRAYTGIMTLSLLPAWLLWRSGGGNA